VRRVRDEVMTKDLTDDQEYALTVYPLHVNKVIGETDRMYVSSPYRVKMPNRDNFFPEFPKLQPSAVDRDG
jgi:hypothetical protein